MKLINIATVFISLIVSMSIQAELPLKAQRADGTDITYYLNQSESNAATLLVLIQGSDCNSVSHNKTINLEFSKVAPKADVLTVEKYGIDSSLSWDNNPERKDCPAQYIAHDSLEQRVEDYKRVLEHINQKQHYNKVIVLGGSEGAVVANLLSSQLDYIDFTVSLNAGGRWFLDDVLHSIKMQSPSKEAYKESADGFIGFAKHIQTSEPFEINMSGHGYKWWRSMLEIDQQSVIESIDSPILLIQSEQDINVAADNAISLAQTLAANKPNISHKTYVDLDHWFKSSDGNSKVSVVIEDIKRWLEHHTAN